MTFLPLDHRIFGNGYGFRSPYFDNVFYWLDGELYTFMAGLGAQLHSVQWRRPLAGEKRVLGGEPFRPLHSHRRWGRVMVAWAWQRLPQPLDEAHRALEWLQGHLGRYSPGPSPHSWSPPARILQES